MTSQKKEIREILEISNAIFDKLVELDDEIEKLMDSEQQNWEQEFQILSFKILTLYNHPCFDQPFLSGCFEDLVEFVQNFDNILWSSSKNITEDLVGN